MKTRHKGTPVIVSFGLGAAWWRDKGARMGRWQDGRIVWEKPA